MNYILSTCINLSVLSIDRFIGSLAETNFSDHLTLFIGPEDLPKFANHTKTKFCIELVICNNKFNPITNRFSEYERYLKNKENVNDVFICDFRDFLFQKNIFEFDFNKLKRYPEEPKKDIYFLMECGYIEECDINIDWINNFLLLYKDYLKEKNICLSDFLKKRVSCAGAVYGNAKGIKSYLEKMSSLIDAFEEVKSGSFFLDQAIHNYLLYFSGMPDLCIGMLDNKDGLVNHASWGVRRLTSFVSPSGEIVNQNNEIAYSVHLYDRNINFLTEMQLSPKWNKYVLELKKKKYERL